MFVYLHCNNFQNRKTYYLRGNFKYLKIECNIKDVTFDDCNYLIYIHALLTIIETKHTSFLTFEVLFNFKYIFFSFYH